MFGLGDQMEGNWRRKSMDKKSLVPDYDGEGTSPRDNKKEQDVAQEGTWRRKSEDRKPEDLGDEIEGGGERKSTEQILHPQLHDEGHMDGEG